MEPTHIRLLLVEDNPDDSELFVESLIDVQGFTFETDVADRTAHAAELLKLKCFDLMFLDLSLPDSNGLDFLEVARGICPGLPIVILTGLNDQSVAYEAASAGAQDYLVKGGYTPEMLGRCVRYAVERARIEHELRIHRDHLGELVAQQTADLRAKTELLEREAEQRKQAEKDLRLMAAAIENGAEAVAVTEADGTICYVNPAFERMTGYERQEAVGRHVREIANDDPMDGTITEIAATLRAGKMWHGEFKQKKKNGGSMTCDISISPVTASGANSHYIAMGRDVTEEVALRERLNRSQRLEAVGQLAGGIAHDFNNVLQAILGYATLSIDDCPAGSELAHNINEISSAAMRAADLTRQLLAFSRRQVLKHQPLNVNEVINSLKSMLQRLLREDIDFDFVPGHELGTVEADTGQLEQVLINLCVNARDAMPYGGRIIVETENVLINGNYVQTHPWARPGRFVLLTVTDTGHGIPADIIDKIFDPFFTTKEEGAGTGLGLATVYGIVKQHEGFIHCYSEAGRGTTFKIYLPMSMRRADSVGTKLEAPSRGGSESVLVVEDDAAIRQLVTKILEKGGYTIHTASDGTEALHMLRNGHNIQCIISDVVMPNLGGIELFERVKQSGQQLPFILASGYSSRTIDPCILEQKGVALIQKPYSPDQLLKTVRTVLDDSRK